MRLRLASPIMIALTHLSNPDEGRRPPSGPRAGLPIGSVGIGCLLAAAVSIVYVGMLADGFAADDFRNLAEARHQGLSYDKLVQPVSGVHWQPLLRAAWAVQFALFGDAPWGYHLVSLALHILNLLALHRLALRLTRSGPAAIVAAAMFGLTMGHANTILWITTQGQLLGTLFFFVSFERFLSYCATARTRDLALSLVAHGLMLTSFTMGAELPLLYAAVIVARPSAEAWQSTRMQRARAIAGYLAVTGSFLVLRSLHVTLSALDALSLDQAGYDTLVQSLRILTHGLYVGFALPAAGTDALVGSIRAGPWLVALTLSAVALLFDYRRIAGTKFVPLLAVLMLMLVIGYSIPIPLRLYRGVEWFGRVDRYRYFPWGAAAIAFGLVFTHLRVFRKDARSAVPRFAAFGWLALVLVANAFQIQVTQQSFRQSSREFAHATSRFVASTVEQVHRHGEIHIVNQLFYLDSTWRAGWNVRPLYVCALSCPEEVLRSVTFINPASQRVISGPVFIAEAGTGKLLPARRTGSPRAAP